MLIIVIIIGEGGSGGALGIGIGDKVFVLDNAYYSVISPEGCAAILWKDNSRSSEAAEALKLTADDLIKLGVIDDKIEEPMGGAHHDIGYTAQKIEEKIELSLNELEKLTPEKLLERRYQKFRKMGILHEK